MTRAPAPKKSLGQHFLSDPSILGRIVSFAGIKAGDAVLEIGPGPGGLTRALVDAGARVTALEADIRMVEHLSAYALPGVEILHGDALKTDYLELAQRLGTRLRLVSNLPYNISGPVTARLLQQRRAFRDMTLMYQREVAERIASGPPGRERGVLSAISQAFCRVEMGFRVPAGAFRPPPKVESAVIRLEVLDAPVEPLEDEEFFWRLVHECFQKRRKMLRNTLRSRAADLEAVFAAVGLDGTERPEELESRTWILLANALRLEKPERRE
jgi:16S rRNA (adenine1518-N6/adenine1519-N6)-dimethyltransferase